MESSATLPRKLLVVVTHNIISLADEPKDDTRGSISNVTKPEAWRLLHHDVRVVSKDDLIRSIGREPEYYRGLGMCLSRLQEKFKSASNGERLFRAVRNRGYCLIQKIVRVKSLT